MTKKQAYKIIKKQYGNYERGSFVPLLCFFIKNHRIREDWTEYWELICQDYSVVSEAFDYGKNYADYDELISMTRLMLLHDFIEDTYE